MKKRKLRKKIARRVSDKMGYLHTCPNERDIILNIILSSKDMYKWNIHCKIDCPNKECVCHPNNRRREEEHNENSQTRET